MRSQRLISYKTEGRQSLTFLFIHFLRAYCNPCQVHKRTFHYDQYVIHGLFFLTRSSESNFFVLQNIVLKWNITFSVTRDSQKLGVFRLPVYSLSTETCQNVLCYRFPDVYSNCVESYHPFIPRYL